MNLIENLKSEFNFRISFREKRPGVLQIVAPLFHEDGDMVDIFLDLPKDQSREVRISDHGMTLMRLSYSYDVETPSRRKVLDRILNENGITEDRGRFYLETLPEHLYPSLLQFAQTIAKVSSMQAFRREVIQSLFYEMLDDFVSSSLTAYSPEGHFLPLPERDDLEVDWRLRLPDRDIFLYGVKDSSKSRLATLSCLEYQKVNIAFRSVIIHEDFEALNRKDQTRITNVADKQFTSLADFESGAEKFFLREAQTTALL